MNITLRIFLVFAIFIYLGIIIYLLKKKKLNLKYTLLWLFSALAMLIVTVFPQIINLIANVVGIVAPANLVFVIEGMFVLLILLSLTAIVSHLTNRVYCLTQKLALVEKRVRELEKKEKI